jgi:hypothetical protein
LSRFAYHYVVTRGLSHGFEDASAARRSAALVRLTTTLGFIAVIVLLYRFSGVDRSALAGQSAVALAALIPLATMYRRALLTLRTGPSLESHAAGIATQRSAS